MISLIVFSLILIAVVIIVLIGLKYDLPLIEIEEHYLTEIRQKRITKTFSILGILTLLPLSFFTYKVTSSINDFQLPEQIVFNDKTQFPTIDHKINPTCELLENVAIQCYGSWFLHPYYEASQLKLTINDEEIIKTIEDDNYLIILNQSTYKFPDNSGGVYVALHDSLTNDDFRLEKINNHYIITVDYLRFKEKRDWPSDQYYSLTISIANTTTLKDFSPEKISYEITLMKK